MDGDPNSFNSSNIYNRIVAKLRDGYSVIVHGRSNSGRDELTELLRLELNDSIVELDKSMSIDRMIDIVNNGKFIATANSRNSDKYSLLGAIGLEADYIKKAALNNIMTVYVENKKIVSLVTSSNE